MKTPFVKMNGAGNDFVMMDNRDRGVSIDTATIQWLCDRRRGIGADGLILVESDSAADFRMRYYNADGGEAEMCGNGARCVALYASQLGLGERVSDGVRLRFMADPGLLTADLRGRRVALGMTDATGFESKRMLSVAVGEEIVHLVNTGVPHAVVEVDDARGLADSEVVERGRAIRRHSDFAPQGSNVNFVSVRADKTVDIRTYERGVEAETLACGTGAVATAVVLSQLQLTQSPVRLVTHGDEDLNVSFSLHATGATSVILEGPATINYDGQVDLSLGGANEV